MDLNQLNQCARVVFVRVCCIGSAFSKKQREELLAHGYKLESARLVAKGRIQWTQTKDPYEGRIGTSYCHKATIGISKG